MTRSGAFRCYHFEGATIVEAPAPFRSQAPEDREERHGVQCLPRANRGRRARRWRRLGSQFCQPESLRSMTDSPAAKPGLITHVR